MALLLLSSATRSVLNFVRTELRTVRLAIACGDRSKGAMHPSQVAGGAYACHSRDKQTSELGNKGGT